jgi:iron complex outermembrane recepter protein
MDRWAILVRGAVVAALAGAGIAPAMAADDESDAIQEVIVTATKRSTALQDTPLAITAVNAAALSDAHVQTIADVTHLVPSFQATTQGDHNVITLTLRGIGNDSAKTEYADPEVALFVDGVYSPRAEGATALLFDLESVEVLRGPQGTLWGRNSTVGAVNMQTIKPSLQGQSAYLEGGAGNFDRFGARGAVNVPLADNLAVRLAFVHEQHDGYVDYQRAPHPSLADQQAAYNAANAASLAAGNGPLPDFQPMNPNLFVQGGPRYGAQDQTALRLSGLWQPIDNLSWNLSYEYFTDRGTPNMNLMQNPRPGERFWSALIDTAPYLRRNVSSVRSRVDYSINDYLNLAYIAGYQHFNGSSDYDQDGGASVPTSFITGAVYQQDRTNTSVYKNYSNEVELQSSGKRKVDWIVGLYQAAENNSIRFDLPIFNGTQQGNIIFQGSFVQPKETVDSHAAFAQATWNTTDSLHLTAGVRYTHDRRENIGGTNNSGPSASSGVPQVPLDPGTDPLDPTSGFTTFQFNDGRYTNDKATYLGRVSYDFNPDFMGYASISTGYKSGGLQDGGVPYGDETLTNYEIGAKNTFLNGRLTLNSAAYYEDFKDFQFSAPVTFANGTRGLATSNAEGAKVYGLESELAARVTDADSVQLSVAYTHTRLGRLIAGSNDYALPSPCRENSGNIVTGISNCLDVTDNELPHAPEIAAQLIYEHRFPLANGATLAPRASVHYESSSWLSVFNLGDGDRQDAYTRTDLGLRYRPESSQSWSIDAYIQNVSDGKVKTNAQNSFGVFQSQYLPPRTFGANVRIDF